MNDGSTGSAKSRPARRERRRTATGDSLNGQPEYKQGRWSALEHYRFLEALKNFGKEWQKVQQHVATRTSTQARSHAQKFFGKLEKKEIPFD